jgi:hypothetical protein
MCSKGWGRRAAFVGEKARERGEGGAKVREAAKELLEELQAFEGLVT